MSAIPVVCRHCGKEGGFDHVGSTTVTVEAWRHVKVCGWDTSTNALTVELGSLEMEPANLWDVEDNIDLTSYCCSHCGQCHATLDELAAPKYGVDRWGRILDEDGTPHGPMAVHPDQMKLELETAA